MKVYSKETKSYIIELTEEERKEFFERMKAPDTADHPFSILGKIQMELQKA